MVSGRGILVIARIGKIFCSVSVVIGILAVVGCQSAGSEFSTFGDSSQSIHDLPDVSFYPNDELVAVGKTQFREKNYGKAFAAFKRATDIYPNDPHALLGLAASADHLARFDIADTAYRRLAPMIGSRPEYYNNVGYSQLLRGNLVQARQYFLRAYEIDPANPTTANNLQLLSNSTSFAQRT